MIYVFTGESLEHDSSKVGIDLDVHKSRLVRAQLQFPAQGLTQSGSSLDMSLQENLYSLDGFSDGLHASMSAWRRPENPSLGSARVLRDGGVWGSLDHVVDESACGDGGGFQRIESMSRVRSVHVHEDDLRRIAARVPRRPDVAGVCVSA